MTAQFDLSTLIQDLIPLIVNSIPEGVRLTLDLVPDLPPIHADPSHLEKVILDRVINEAQAIGPDGGSIQVTTGLRDAPAADEVFIAIADAGSGVDNATFRVYFPAIQQHPEPARAVAGVEARPPYIAKVLVVDDEALLLMLAETILTRIGCIVALADNGRKALEIFSADPNSFAAVILDMTMPVMGGKETLRHIREIRSTVPVVIVTGYSEDIARDELGSDPALSFVHKPYSPERLTAKIQDVLKNAGMAAQAAGR